MIYCYCDRTVINSNHTLIKQVKTMSISTISTIMSRIESATLVSRIAVFRSPETKKLEVCFADTVLGKQRVVEGVDLIGVYDKTMNMHRVRGELLHVSR